MGDISELRGLLTVISFMGVVIILVLFIPHSLFAFSNYETRRQSKVPEYFEGIDVQQFSSTIHFTLNFSLDYYQFEIGGHFVTLYVYGDKPLQTDRILIEHYFKWWIFNYDFHGMDWYAEGKKISYTDTYGTKGLLAINVLDEYEYGQNYIMKCEHFQSTVVFGYNQTEYSNHLEAFNDEALAVFFGVDFDQQITSFNAWNLVGMILFFQMPDIHPAINMMIAIPFWVCIAYLIYVLILKAIPFVG